MRRRLGRSGPRIVAVCAAAVLSGCVTPVEEDVWIEARTANFTLVSNATPEQASELGRGLELFRSVVQRMTNAVRFDPRVPTLIYAFKGTGSFRPFRSRSLVAAYIAPRTHANYIALNAGESSLRPLDSVHHEYFHFILRNQPGPKEWYYPPWYDEGMAELLSTVVVQGDDVHIGRVPQGRVPSLQGFRAGAMQQLMTQTSATEGSAFKVWAFYAQAWLLAHYLVAGHNALGGEPRVAQAQRYVDLVNNGAEPELACQQAFGLTFQELGEEVGRYLKGNQFPYMVVPLSVFPHDDAVELRTLSAQERAYLLGDLALNAGGGERVELAERLFAYSLAADPGYAPALAGLGIVKAYQGQVDESDALFDRALELGPSDVRVLLTHADYMLGLARSNPDRAAVFAKSARRRYARVVELAPELPAGHAGLGSTYLYTREDRTPGIEALERARSLLRSSTTIALRLGWLHLRAGSHDRARDLLEEVARWSHADGGEAQQARELLRELRSATLQEAKRKLELGPPAR